MHNKSFNITPPPPPSHANGFTLIELLTVVLIIGILTAIALPMYQQAVKKSKMAQLITITKSFGEAQRRYFLAHGEYTTDFDVLDIDIQGEIFENIPGSYTKDIENKFRIQLRQASGMPLYVLGGFLNASDMPSSIRYFVEAGEMYCTISTGKDYSLCKLYGTQSTCPKMPVSGVTCFKMK